jgi:hypothetical protein
MKRVKQRYGCRVTGESRPEIPERIVSIAKTRLPPEADSETFWRSVDAEIIPKFREEIRLAVYDEWLALQLTHLWKKMNGQLTPDETYGDYRQIDKLLESPDLKAASGDQSPLREEADFVRDQLADHRREWRTDMLAPRLGRPNKRFLRELFGSLHEPPTENPETDNLDREPSQSTRGPPFDRLPAPLMSLIVNAFPRESRGDQVWNRVREFVYPHFNEDLLKHPAYRRYLAILVKFHAFDESPNRLCREAKVLHLLLTDEEMYPDARGKMTHADRDVICRKLEDVIQTLESAEAIQRRQPAPRSKPPPDPPNRQR